MTRLQLIALRVADRDRWADIVRDDGDLGLVCLATSWRWRRELGIYQPRGGRRVGAGRKKRMGI